MPFALLFVLLVPIGIAFFVLFDLLIRREHKYYREAWEKDQQPIGYTWKPRGSSMWAGSIARSRLCSSWLKHTPDWMLTDRKALRLLFWYRWLWRVFMAGWLAVVIYVVVSKAKE